MSSGDVHDGEHEGEEKGGGEASSLKEDDGRVQSGDGSSAVQHEDKLGEEWPQIEVDRGKGFVVCTIDTQLLSDTVQVMHSQINLLRQTVLNLRQTESREMADLRRQINALEKSGPGNAKAQLDDIDTRLRAVEQQPGGSRMDAGQNKRLQLLEGAMWGGSTEVAKNYPSSETAPPDEAATEEEEDGTLEVVEHSGTEEDLEAREDGEGEDADTDAAGAAPKKPSKIKAVARAVLMFGGGMALCPKVDTLQNQLDTIDGRERQVEERMAALESKLAADAEGEKAAAAERRLKSLDQLLHQAVVLRRTLLADTGIAAVAEGAEAADDEAWWAETGAREEVLMSEGRTGGTGEEQATEGELLFKARARLAWLETQAERIPPLGTSATAAAAAVSPGDAVARDNSIDGDSLESERGGGDQERPAGASPTLAWAPLVEEEGGNAGGGTTTDEEVERLWRRMNEVENRIYQAAVDERRLQAQVSGTPAPPPAAEVTGADLKDLRESLEHSSKALGLKLQDGLGSLSGRIELLEDNVRMVKARALSRSALDAVSAAAAAAAAATAPAGAPPPAVAPADDSRIEQILASVLGDEIPMVRRNLEVVKDRVASLEAALEDAAAPPGLSAEEAAAAAADAARQANEETQARMIAEMSALEERMDRRAREEARRAREEREAAEARGSMRRVSATVSAYTADLAMRLEGLRSEHEQQGAVVTRTAEEVAAAEASLRDFGSELVGLGQVANSVSMVVDGKADQTDVEALKAAMDRLNATIAAKAKGSSATAARDAEALGALQAAFKDMSTSMEGSMRKLQQAQAAAGSIKIKPLLDRVVKELTAAGMLPDPDAGQGAAGRSMCLSCNRPMILAGDQSPSRFANQFRGGTLGNRMEKVSSASPLQINKPAVIWRGGFKMPPRRAPASSHERQQQQQQQQQHHPQQHQRAETTGTLGSDGRRGGPLSAGNGGGRGMGASPSQPLLPASSSVRIGAGLDAIGDSRLPGIPNMLDSAGGRERGITGAGVMGVGGRAGRVSVGSLTASADAPHRARYVRQR